MNMKLSVELGYANYTERLEFESKQNGEDDVFEYLATCIAEIAAKCPRPYGTLANAVLSLTDGCGGNVAPIIDEEKVLIDAAENTEKGWSQFDTKRDSNA